jgi:hypothetical protein
MGTRAPRGCRNDHCYRPRGAHPGLCAYRVSAHPPPPLINSTCFPSATTGGYQSDEYDWSPAWAALLVARKLGACAATEPPAASAVDEDPDDLPPPPSKAEAPLEFRVALSLCLAYVALQRGFYADALAAAATVLASPHAVAPAHLAVAHQYAAEAQFYLVQDSAARIHLEKAEGHVGSSPVRGTLRLAIDGNFY